MSTPILVVGPKIKDRTKVMALLTRFIVRKKQGITINFMHALLLILLFIIKCLI